MVAPNTNPELETDGASPASPGRGGDRDDGASRRQFLGGAAAAGAGATLLSSRPAGARTQPALAAQPPAGFVPLSAPCRDLTASKAGCLYAYRPLPEAERPKK